MLHLTPVLDDSQEADAYDGNDDKSIDEAYRVIRERVKSGGPGWTPRVEGWDTSCPDWEDRIMSGRSLVPDLPLFEAEAAKALRVFKRLRLADVIGTPTMGEVCGPWFYPIVAALIGSYDPATNKRHISEIFE